MCPIVACWWSSFVGRASHYLAQYMHEADNVQPNHHKASIPKSPATTKQVAVTTATLIKQASYIGVQCMRAHPISCRIGYTPWRRCCPPRPYRRWQAFLIKEPRHGARPPRARDGAEPLRRACAVLVRATFARDYAEKRLPPPFSYMVWFDALAHFVMVTRPNQTKHN